MLIVVSLFLMEVLAVVVAVAAAMKNAGLFFFIGDQVAVAG